ncbi:hypothetical protein SAMD00019534_029330, partial [Acytostelium subglobosum LB1]|uniref:hypothetical protein n=1 Tax=Acytostelium subglobosum LB1 TaxID=1410327 RepID=UPI000644E5B5
MASVWVQAGSALVQKDDGWVANEGHGKAQTTLHATTQQGTGHICLVLQVDLAQRRDDRRLERLGWYTLDLAKQAKVLSARQLRIEDVVLWAEANVLANVVHLSAYAAPIDPCVATCWWHHTGENAHRCGLACTVMSEQSKDCAAGDA